MSGTWPPTGSRPVWTRATPRCFCSRAYRPAELHLLLSMITPLPWLERVPSYKDQQAQMPDRDLSTYGFLGYPLLQSADILIYRAGLVPVGEDQVAHVEITREVARRFQPPLRAGTGLRGDGGRGDPEARQEKRQALPGVAPGFPRTGRQAGSGHRPALLERQKNMTLGNRSGCSATSRAGAAYPARGRALLTHAPKMPGLDGRKMSSPTPTRFRCARAAGVEKS